MTATRRVSLVSGELPSGVASHIDVHIDEEGGLVLEGRDLGASVNEIWGDSDSEWWIRVRAAEKPKLLDRLRGAPAIRSDDDDEVLLALLAQRFGGRPRRRSARP